MKKIFKIGLLGVLMVVLAACGQEDTMDGAEDASFEMNLDGHWTVTEALLDGEPVVDLAEEFNEDLDFDLDQYTTEEDGKRVLDVDFYYDDGLMTIVDSEGESVHLSYEILERDEENKQLTLEYILNDEDVVVRIDEIMTFSEEGKRISTETNIGDVTFLRDEDEEPSQYEEELANFGGRMALEFIYGLDLELDLEYVDEASSPR